MSNNVEQTSVESVVTSDELHASDVHAALADERRRVTLDVLTDGTTPVDAADLARRVAARETESQPGTAPEDRVERVHAMLHHVHLPKLADLGVIGYDDDATAVTAVANGLETTLS